MAKLTEWELQKVNFTKDYKDGPQDRVLTKTKNLYQKATNNRHNRIIMECLKVTNFKGKKKVLGYAAKGSLDLICNGHSMCADTEEGRKWPGAL